MSETVRYCVVCGSEVNGSPNCTNPDCAGIPNYYRNVPAPDHVRQRRPFKPREGGAEARAGAPVRRLESSPTGTTTVPDGSRMTMAMQLTPVAVLRGVESGGGEHPIQVGFTEVGASGSAKIRVKHPEVSSRHATIECKSGSGGQIEINVVDHGSTNGTYVNDERVEKRRLISGDRVRFASVAFELEILQDDEPRMTVQM